MRKLGLLAVFACMLSGQEATAVQLVPGITTTLKRNPAGLRESFAVTASAAQTLLVEVNIENPDSRSDDRIEVSGPDGEAMKSELENNASANWMNVVPRTGTYRVTLLLSSTRPYVLRMTVMNPHDPRIDIGLRPDQISLSGVAKDIQWSRSKFSPVVKELADYGPDYLVAHVGDIELRVMAVEGVKKTWWIEDEGAKRVARLEAALKFGVFTVSPQEFPGGATDQAELTFAARKLVINGSGLRAVRWVGKYSQMDIAPWSPLDYAADGITPDGRFVVTIRGSVVHPAVPIDVLDLEGDQLRAFRLQLARKLDAAPDAAFAPALEKLDQLVRAFAIH